MAQTIIVTGASRGIGKAICERLLQSPSGNVVAVARTESALLSIQSIAPHRVAVLMADMKDFASGQKAVDLAIDRFGGLDGVIVNHGIIEPVQRIADANIEDWQRAFDINVFSVIGLLKAALPSLRSAHGKIILTSSGAAVKGTSAWGAYSSSKAVYNSLVRTLAVEEPSVMTVAIRPGVVDTEMQATLAAKHFDVMDKKDSQKFQSMKADGKMLRPEQPGNVIARLVVRGEACLSGMFLDWNSDELENYQD